MFELTDEERHSALWMKLSLYLQKEIENARKANDQVQCEADTNFLRGKIKVLKGMLNLGGSTSPPVE